LRELGLEVGKKVSGHAAILARRAGPESGCESLDTLVKNLTKGEVG
jgi:hypothetical protein